MRATRTILVPYDFSAYSEAALDAAEELAEALGGEIHLLHVLQPPHYLYAAELYPYLDGELGDGTAPLRESCLHRLETVATSRTATRVPIHPRVTEATHVAHAIAGEAEERDVDLIAMGTHGRTGLAHLLLGSVAEETVRRARCPVLTVPLDRAAPHQTTDRWESSRHPAEGSF